MQRFDDGCNHGAEGAWPRLASLRDGLFDADLESSGQRCNIACPLLREDAAAFEQVAPPIGAVKRLVLTCARARLQTFLGVSVHSASQSRKPDWNLRGAAPISTDDRGSDDKAARTGFPTTRSPFHRLVVYSTMQYTRRRAGLLPIGTSSRCPAWPRSTHQPRHHRKQLTMDPIEQAVMDGQNRLDLFEALAMNALIQRNYPPPGTNEQVLDANRTWIAREAKLLALALSGSDIPPAPAPQDVVVL